MIVAIRTAFVVLIAVISIAAAACPPVINVAAIGGYAQKTVIV